MIYIVFFISIVQECWVEYAGQSKGSSIQVRVIYAITKA